MTSSFASDLIINEAQHNIKRINFVSLGNKQMDNPHSENYFQTYPTSLIHRKIHEVSKSIIKELNMI